MKNFGYAIGIICALILLIVGARFLSLEANRYFSPKEQNVDRQVFESTKSYTHGVQADLGKYFNEYQKANAERKETLKAVIRARFPSINASNIQNPVMRSFLIQARGY